MGQGCVFFTIRGKLFGISIENLMKLGKDEILDWDSSWQPPASPFYMVDLPDHRWYIVHPFILDSKIYVLGGGVVENYQGVDPDDPPCKIYQFDINGKGFTLDHSLPHPPTRYVPAFVGNIPDGADFVHMLAFQGGCFPYDDDEKTDDENMWSLSPGGKWEPLGLHDDLCDTCMFNVEYYRGINLQDKILIQLASGHENFLYLFDSKTKQWKLMDTSLCGSWISQLHYYRACLMISFPNRHWSNHRLILSWEAIYSHHSSYGGTALIIKAFMVNEENLATIYYQSLWECFEGIQHPTLFDLSQTTVNFVDLGNNTICALVHGITYAEPHTSLICVSIFKILPLRIGPTETPLVIGFDHSLQEERKFLSIDVIVKRVFHTKNLSNRWRRPVLSPFVFNSKIDLQKCFAFGDKDSSSSLLN